MEERVSRTQSPDRVKWPSFGILLLRASFCLALYLSLVNLKAAICGSNCQTQMLYL